MKAVLQRPRRWSGVAAADVRRQHITDQTESKLRQPKWSGVAGDVVAQVSQFARSHRQVKLHMSDTRSGQVERSQEQRMHGGGSSACEILAELKHTVVVIRREFQRNTCDAVN